MKQKLLNSFKLRAIMLVAALCAVFTGQAWADKETVNLWSEDFSSYAANDVPSGGTYSYSVTNGGGTTKIYNENTAGSTAPELLVAKSNGTFTATITDLKGCTDGFTLTFITNRTELTPSVKSHTSTGIGTADGKVTGTTQSKQTSTYTIELPTNATDIIITFTMTISSNARLDDIVLTGEKETSDPDKTDVTLSFPQPSYTVTLGESFTAPTASSDPEVIGITYSSDNEDVATVNEATGEVAIEGVGTANITASFAGNDTYNPTSVSYALIVNPAPFTVTLGDDNSTLSEVSGGAGVTLPTRSDISDYAFAGWSTTNVATETTEAPVIIPAGEYQPTANITLFPVYSKTEGGGGTVEKTANVSISEYATDNGWGSSSSASQKSITIDANITATCNDGTNSGKYYSDWRIYQTESGKITISTTKGELTSVTFTFTISNTGTLNYNGTVVTSGTPVAVSGTSAEFTVGNSGSATNGQVRLTDISVDYTIPSGGTTYYWSAPVAAAVERPTIEIEENPFFFSTTASITCETDGATIKYSYDGETWSDYTEALTLTATTTIYAKAIKGEDESLVATVTATKNLAPPTVTIVAEGITNTDVSEGTTAGSLAAYVTYNNDVVEGATVTWSGSNDEVATIDPSTGAVTLVAAGSVTFTATYAGNSDYSEKTATYVMDVIDPNAPGTENNPFTVAQVLSGAADGKTDIYVKGFIVGSYNSTAPKTPDDDGVEKTNLALADSYNETSGSNTIPVQLPNNDLRTNFNVVDHPRYFRVSQVLIKADGLTYFLVPGLKNTDEITMIAEAVSISDPGFATWASDNPLDFSGVTEMYAYIAKQDGDRIQFTRVQKVPAETGVLLRSAEGGDASVVVPVLDGEAEAVTGNVFKPALTEIAALASTEGENSNYILSKEGNNVGFYLANNRKVAAGRAYIQVPTAEGVKGFALDFDNETAINEIVNGQALNGKWFNLSGQRVNRAQKGIFIVNGKKIVK